MVTGVMPMNFLDPSGKISRLGLRKFFKVRKFTLRKSALDALFSSVRCRRATRTSPPTSTDENMSKWLSPLSSEKFIFLKNRFRVAAKRLNRWPPFLVANDPWVRGPRTPSLVKIPIGVSEKSRIEARNLDFKIFFLPVFGL